MQLNPFSFHKQLLKQIVVEVGIVDHNKQKHLTQQFQKKYSKHINLIQHHQLRQDRFSLTQKKVLEKQHLSIQKTKEFIKLRQSKADSLKYHIIADKSKRVETNLYKWEKIIEKNKEEHQKKLNQSVDLIKQWNQKLSKSTSRKGVRLDNISRTLQQKSDQKMSRLLIHRLTEQQEQQLKIKNCETELTRKQSESRYKNNASSRRNSRVSTQNVHYRVKKSEEDLLQKSLVKNGQKNQKISEARYMKLLMHQKKNKIRQQKQENLKRLREHHLNSIQQQVNERNQELNKKFKSDKAKVRNNKSLPSVVDTDPVYITQCRIQIHSIPHQNSPSQNIHTNNQAMSQRSKEWSPSYDRKIIQKLRNVAILVRKGKKI